MTTTHLVEGEELLHLDVVAGVGRRRGESHLVVPHRRLMIT